VFNYAPRHKDVWGGGGSLDRSWSVDEQV